jgi:hypothetical protein
MSKLAMMLTLVVLAVGSAVSARTVYEERTVYDPYYGPSTEVDKFHVHPDRRYYYDNGPSVGGFIDRSAKTTIGLPGKAAKETLKAIF